MRNRWEERDKTGVDLDAPVTITEREWRALRRRAGFGVPAVLLGCIAVGGLVWALYAGPEGLERIQDVKERYIAQAADGSESAATEAAAPAQPQTRPTDSAMTSVPTTDSVTTAPPPGATPESREETRRAATQGSAGH